MGEDIHKNLEAIKNVALYYAEIHNCNYNIILMNPNEDGTPSDSSTYEYVADSYFEKERPNVLLLFKTDDILNKGKTIDEIREENYQIEIDRLTNFDNTHVNQYLQLMRDDLMGEGFSRGITYVRETPKIGRNEPCSCGSGKKYKKCCL